MILTGVHRIINVKRSVCRLTSHILNFLVPECPYFLGSDVDCMTKVFGARVELHFEHHRLLDVNRVELHKHVTVHDRIVSVLRLSSNYDSENVPFVCQ